MKSLYLLWDRSGWVTLAMCFASVFKAQTNAQTTIDSSFNTALNGTVSSMAVQADGKILLGGTFTMVNGTGRSYLARLHPNGSLDDTFAPTNGPAQTVSRVLVQNSKIYVGGGDGLRRFSEDGSLDWHYPMNAATFAIDSQQRVFIGGQFTRVEGQYHRNIARLTAAGALDPAFSAAIGCCAGESVDALATQGDAVLAGGLFQSVDGTYAASHLARIGADGSFDTTFAATAAPRVIAIAAMPDGNVFHLSQQTLVRHLATGTDDPAFTPVRATSSSDDRFAALTVGPDGRPIVGGSFTLDGSATRTFVARFGPDGMPDRSFTVVPDGAVESMALQADGQVLIGGLFTTVNGFAHAGIARVSAGAAPELAVTRGEAGRLVLSWSANIGDYVLETTMLNAAAWSAVGNTPIVADGRNFVTNAAVGAGQLFRLRSRP